MTEPPEPMTRMTREEYAKLPERQRRALRRAWRKLVSPLASTPNGAPFPLRSWPPDAAIDIQALAEWVDPRVPPGAIMVWASAAPPAGWALCNGALLSRADHPALFAAIGVTHGIGDGVNTFATPNLQGLVVVAAGAGFALYGTGGTVSETLTPSQMPSHSHQMDTRDYDFGGNPASGGGQVAYGAVATSLRNGAAATNAAGGGLPHNNMPPYVALHYIIKL